VLYLLSFLHRPCRKCSDLRSHASAAFVAAAPDNADIAVPVDATPYVVAIPIATAGVSAATAIPAAIPTAPVPAAVNCSVLYFSLILSA
jgi:hypothetical protein